MQKKLKEFNIRMRWAKVRMHNRAYDVPGASS